MSWLLLAALAIGQSQSLERELAELAELDKIIQAEPKRADAYFERGCVYFKLGKFAESVRDFDKHIELNPKAKISHWQRGISCYYAGLYDEGKKQFEGYQDFDSNDVENAVWRYMCMAKASGIDKARQAMLKIGDDKRVPMRQVYEMFSGRLKPADVLDKANMGMDNDKTLWNRQMFYAHLYVGIHYHIEGDRKKALEHLEKAVEHRIGHYMWDVARVHRDVVKQQVEKKQEK